MKKSRTFKLFSARTAMLMLATLFSVGAWAQYWGGEDESRALVFSDPSGPGQYKLTMNGKAEVDVNVDKDLNIQAYAIEYNRTFQVGVPATVVFPFPTYGMTVTGGYFYEFDNVKWDANKGQWVATMTEVDADNLERNCPYIVVPAATELEFDLRGQTVHVYTGDATVENDRWAFVGTYKKTYWIDADMDLGNTEFYEDYEVVGTGEFYGFAASSGSAVGGQSVSAGEFVKCRGNDSYDNSAFVRPLRAYLQYVGDRDHLACDDTKMLQRAAAADTTLPASIAVVLLGKDGEVTSIGTISDKTGEMTFGGWYTLDGVKLPAEPTEGGVYIHNGKKVAVK
jgi:hypothetical protein